MILRAARRGLDPIAQPPLAACAALALAASLVACQPAPTSELAFADGRVQLAATDPGVLDEAESFVIAMFFGPSGGNSCGELLDMSMSELAALRVDQQDTSSSQVKPARDEDGEPGAHAFGRIGAPGRYSYLLVASRRGEGEYTDAEPLAGAAGSVFAIGCQEVEVRIGQRHDLRIVLFPAGLR